jgi:hypothetical protein
MGASRVWLRSQFEVNHHTGPVPVVETVVAIRTPGLLQRLGAIGEVIDASNEVPPRTAANSR